MTKAVVKKKKKIDIEHLTELIRNIKSMEQAEKELEAQVKEAKNEIKEVMTSNGLEEMCVDVFTVRYKPIITNRFDSKKFQGSYKELYDAFCAPSESMKLTIT